MLLKQSVDWQLLRCKFVHLFVVRFNICISISDISAKTFQSRWLPGRFKLAFQQLEQSFMRLATPYGTSCKKIYLVAPNTAECIKFKKILLTKSGMPHTLAADDGKHVGKHISSSGLCCQLHICRSWHRDLWKQKEKEYLSSPLTFRIQVHFLTRQ